MKKGSYIFVIIVLVLILLCIRLNSKKSITYVKGDILLNVTSNGVNKISMYDCSRNDFYELSLDGVHAKFSSEDTILINRFDNIVEYDLNTQNETVVYENESIDFFDIRNDKQLSISKDNYIFLYDMETKEKKILVEDNGSKNHSWSKDGTFLCYSDLNYQIRTIDVLSSEINEICRGSNPIMYDSIIAYKDKEQLIVRDMQTNNEYKYSGCAYSYCFSPTGNEVLIEDELSMGVGIKNFFKGDVVMGHRIVIWNYKSNQKSTIIDSCVSTPNLICDWGLYESTSP